MVDVLEHFAAVRPPRGQEQCACCEGDGVHETRTCARCGGTGFVRKGSDDPFCPGREDDCIPKRRHWRQAARRDPWHGEGPWYHGSPEELSEGDVIVPGDVIGKQHMGRGSDSTRTWVTNDAWKASSYGTNVYEVEPSVPPKSMYARHHEHYLPEGGTARVIRKVPYQEATELSPEYQRGKRAMEKQIREQRRQQREGVLHGPDELPPDPGTAPIPEGHVRLWHYTSGENVPSIREHGLQRKYARGDSGTGDLSEPSAGVWASTKRPDDILDEHSSPAAVVEYHAHPDEISGNAESPWQAKRKDGGYDPEKLRDWAGGYHHVIMRGDVHPGRILAIHEGWHGAARYMKQDDPSLQSYQWIHDESKEPWNDHLKPYRRGLEALERQRGQRHEGARQPGITTTLTGDLPYYHVTMRPGPVTSLPASPHGESGPGVYLAGDQAYADHMASWNPGVSRILRVTVHAGSGLHLLDRTKPGGEEEYRRIQAWENGNKNEGMDRALGAHGYHGVHYLSPGNRYPETVIHDPSRLSVSDPHTAMRRVATDPAEYRMQHEGPDPGEGEGLHEIGSGKIWPTDFHQRPWEYALGADHESMGKVLGSKDWPSRKVWAYRALPSPHREVNTGDWVSTSPRYARSEGRTSTNPDDDYPVVKFQARAEHLRNEGNSLDEWSYTGPKINRALVHFSGGRNHRGKGPRGGRTDAMCHEHEPEEMYQQYEAQNRERRERRRAERERLGSRETGPYMSTPQSGDPMWRHLSQEHGIGLKPGSGRPANAFLDGLHDKFHSGQVPDKRVIQHRHGDPSPGEDLKSRLFTPDPEYRPPPEPRHEPEPLDDREYSIRDVSRRYDWEGFSPHEIEHLVHDPEHAAFTREDVPVQSLRTLDRRGRMKKPISYAGIARQGEDERDRLAELERGYDQGADIPPIVVVRHGRHHLIADGSHRAAVHAERGASHIEAFVTERTIFPPRERTAAAAPEIGFQQDYHGRHRVWAAGEDGLEAGASGYGHTAGELHWHPETGTITYLNVKEGYRRQGIATALYRRAQAEAAARGLAAPAHSSSRSPDGGDAWARSVGGHLPPLEASFDWSALTHGRYDVPTEAVYALRQHEQRNSGKYPHLAEEVAERGIEQPLEVSLHDDGRVVLRGGSHRVNIAHDRSFPTVPVQVVDMRRMAGQRGQLPDLAYYHVLQGREKGGFHALVAAHEGTVIGHMSWGPSDNRIGQLWVHPDYRRHGVADAMYQRAKWVEPGLRHHPDRTEAGEAWAQSASPDAPERLHDTTSADAERKGEWAASQFQERLDSGHRTMKRLAVLPMPGYRNPHTGGDEWFHGTKAYPEELSEHGFTDPAEMDPMRYEHPDADPEGHWNQNLGTHFTADHDIAKAFAAGEHSSGRNQRGGEDFWHGHLRGEARGIVHARLGLRNPKVYKSEHDMDHEAYEDEWKAGNTYVKHLPQLESDDEDDRAEMEEMWPEATRIHQQFRQHKIPRDHIEGSFGYGMNPHPTRTTWLNRHPDRYGISERFKAKLQAQGHDGIIYGNEYEVSKHGGQANKSAIVFDPGRIQVTQHHGVYADHLSPEEGEHQQARMPGAGQQELPFERAGVFVPTERIFGPTYGLDHRLFDESERLRPAVRDALMSRLGPVLESVLGPDWHLVTTAWLAGSQASKWTGPDLEGNGDLDVLIGLSHGHARMVAPGLAQMSDEEIERHLNRVLRERFNAPGWHPPFDPDGKPYDLTGYAIHTADIRTINPYAAWDLTNGSWAVTPPDLPDWSAEQFPQGPAVLQQARALIAEVRAILRLPEPFRRQEAERIWHYIHEGRAQAFSPGGMGWQGTGNVLEKALDQASGALVGKLKQVIYGPPDDQPSALGHGMTTADLAGAHA